MPSRKPATVADYLAQLPTDRRKVIAKVRSAVRRAMPKGYREGLCWGMIGYFIPLSRYPDTYNGQPLLYAGLAAHKNYYALHLMGVYGSSNQRKALETGYRKAGKRLDAGKACVRFRAVEDLPLEVITTLIAEITPERYIRFYEASRKR